MSQIKSRSQTATTKTSAPAYTEHQVARGQYQIYARDYSGAEPAIVLLHGFPDTLRLYDLLVPFLTSQRRVITFDFLGWGQSDKPKGFPYTHDNMTADLDAVIRHFELQQVAVVVHDASGPAGIDWALNNPAKVANLILLNTYYSAMSGLRYPETILTFSTPWLGKLAGKLVMGGIAKRLRVFERVFSWQVGLRFTRDVYNQKRFVPIFLQQFLDQPSAFGAFLSLAQDLRSTLKSRRERTWEAQKFAQPVRIIFGEKDPYLNPSVARGFQKLFPSAELFLLPTVKHFPQLDEPERVAQLLLSALSH